MINRKILQDTVQSPHKRNTIQLLNLVGLTISQRSKDSQLRLRIRKETVRSLKRSKTTSTLQERDQLCMPYSGSAIS